MVDVAELKKTETPPPDTEALAVAELTKTLTLVSFIFKAPSKETVGVALMLNGNIIVPVLAELTAPAHNIVFPSFEDIFQ